MFCILLTNFFYLFEKVGKVYFRRKTLSRKTNFKYQLINEWVKFWYYIDKKTTLQVWAWAHLIARIYFFLKYLFLFYYFQYFTNKHFSPALFSPQTRFVWFISVLLWLLASYLFFFFACDSKYSLIYFLRLIHNNKKQKNTFLNGRTCACVYVCMYKYFNRL